MMYCSRIIPRYFFKNLSASVNVLRNNSFWQNSQLAELLVPLLGRYLHFVFCNISQVSSIQILSFKEVLRKSWLFGWPVHVGLHGCLWEPTGHCRPELRAMSTFSTPTVARFQCELDSCRAAPRLVTHLWRAACSWNLIGSYWLLLCDLTENFDLYESQLPDGDQSLP